MEPGEASAKLAASAPQGASGRFLVGALCVMAAGLSWSTTGLFLRLAPHLDSWQFLFWRSFGVACAFAALMRFSGAGSLYARIAAMGRMGALVVSALAISSIAFIVAMKSTTVANALFLSSCSPLMAAGIGYFALGERLGRAQVAAIGLGFAGLAVIVGGGVEFGNASGNICAVLTAFGFAVSSVAMRAGRGRNYTPALFCYGVLVCVVSGGVCLARGEPLLAAPAEVAAAFSGGFLAMGVGFAFFLRGAPDTPAAAQTVLAQTETIFGPVWVWLAFGETPGLATLVGGAIILAAVVGMSAAGVVALRPAHA